MLFRTFVYVGLLLVTAGSAVAQNTVAGIGEEDKFVYFNRAIEVHSFDAPDEEVQKVKAALNLTEVQVNAVKALLKVRDGATHQILQEVEAAQMKLHDLANQANSNATELGTAFMAVETAHQRMKAAGDKFRTDFEALLNAEQRSQLARLSAASEQIEALRRLQLLDNGAMEMALPFHTKGYAGIAGPAIRFEHSVPGNK